MNQADTCYRLQLAGTTWQLTGPGTAIRVTNGLAVRVLVGDKAIPLTLVQSSTGQWYAASDGGLQLWAISNLTGFDFVLIKE